MTTFLKRRWPLFVVLLALAGGGVAWWGSHLRGEGKSEARPAVPAAPSEVPVTVAPATPRPVERSIEVVGTLEGHEEVNLGAKVEGRIARIHHDVGDEVAPGQPLVDLDDVDYKLAALEARRGLDLELARLGLTELPGDGKLDLSRVPMVARARNVEENARQVMERARRLTSGRVIGAEEWEKTQTESRVALSNREHAELEALATLATARLRAAQVDTAEQRVRDCRVVVPCPSPARMPACCKDPRQLRYVVAARKVAEGEMVRAMPAVTLFRLVIDNPLKLVVTVPERHLSEVKVGQPVSLSVEAYPGETFAGSVARVNPTVDRGSRAFTIEVTVPNDAKKLRPGSFVKARVQTRKADAALTVPEEAVVRFAGVVKVFTVAGGVAKAVPVRTGEVLTVADGGKAHRWVEVVGDLPAGAEVVTSGQSQLADRTPVRKRG
jgi:multidrug efflux pump subunit AcrA (membrane-fusion protein)